MDWINLTALWKIIVFGLIADAGLPALFAAGLYSLSRGPKLQAADADGTGSDAVVGGSAVGMIVAAICFLIVIAAIVWGVYEVYVTGHPAAK
ncbi:MAG TPA: hypothetical protein VGG75_15160 [Trebonia sp.]